MKSGKNVKKESVIVLELLDSNNKNNYNNYNNYNNKDKIIISIINKYKTISNISKELSLSIDLVSKTVYFANRETGLLVEGLIESKRMEGKPHYKASEKGIKHIITLIEAEKRQEEEKVEAIKKLEWKKKQGAKLIEQFLKFFEGYKIKPKNHVLIIKYEELLSFSAPLVEQLLEDYENVIKAVGIASVEKWDDPQIHIRISNISNSQKFSIGQLRSEHIGKFIKISGTVSQIGDVRPQTTSARFECPSCGNIINVLQLDTQFKEPTRCGCGRKGKFKLLSKELVDAQGLVLEEMPEDMHGRSEPKPMNILLKDDLTNYNIQPYFENSDPITIIGVLCEVPIITRHGTKSTRFDLMVDANNIIFENIKNNSISDEDLEKIKVIAKSKDRDKILINIFAPKIFDMDWVKKGILLSVVSGGNPDSKERDDSHCLLIGDPGKGKSELLKAVKEIRPTSRWVSGKTATAVGLIGSTIKDEFTKGYALKKGAMALANNDIVCIDELDKMHPNDRDALHETMENQFCSIDKANKHAKFKTDVTVISAMNPINSRFNLQDSAYSQIDLPQPLIDRFDLIFPTKDYADKEKDKELAEKILNSYEEKPSEENTDILRKYLEHARTLKPNLSKKSKQRIIEEYAKLRQQTTAEESSVVISARHLKALCRLSIASAKLRLSDSTNKQDTELAINLLRYSLTQLDLLQSQKKISNVLSEEKVTDDLIHHKCTICGETPCKDYYKNKPYCEGCLAQMKFKD